MEKALDLFIGTNNHVPYGASDGEFEMVYNGRLKPFIVALNRFPKIRAVLHYSGVLLNWLEKIHPEFFMLIGDLIARRQVEIAGGGFYEPMLPLIPPQDRIGQIEMLTTYIRKQFGKRPLGCWLPSSAWDQGLVGALTACGMGYTFLQEEQFLRAGLSGEDIYAPCITEDQGRLLMVMPVLTGLSLKARRESISGLLEQAASGTPAGKTRLVMLCPDCFFQEESGGITGAESLNLFFEDLSRAESFVNFTLPQMAFRVKTARKKIWFLPCTDRDSTPPKYFLSRYPEAGGVYSRMMLTHLLVNQLRGDKARKQSAQEELWKGQDYAVFCRLGGGGIFRNSVRNAAYRAFIEAEKTVRQKSSFIPSLMIYDFDLDGVDEYVFQVENISCCVKTLGAGIFEFDFFPRSWNYLDTFGAEAASPDHADAAKPDSGGLRRNSFVDILAPVDVPPEELYRTGFGAVRNGVRFCGTELWEAGDSDKAKRKAVFLLPPRSEGPFAGISIKKEYCLKRDTLTLCYIITNQGETDESFCFIPRIDLALSGEGDLYQRFYRISPPGEDAVYDGEREALAPGQNGVIAAETAALEIQDLKNEVILTLFSDRVFEAAIVPVRSRCPVYGEERDLYQSTCILPSRRIDLAPGASSSAEFNLRLVH